MDYSKFISGWSMVSKRMNCRFDEDYFRWNADDMKVDLWDELLVKEVFDDISRMNPKNIDISAGEIKRLYWNKYNDKNIQKLLNDERIECSKGLCDGAGIIHATLLKGSILRGDKIPAITTGEDYPGYVFRCDCSLGIGSKSQCKQWKDRNNERKYKIDDETIYKDSEQKRYDIIPKVTYLAESMKMDGNY